MVPQATMKVPVVDDSADIAPAAPAATVTAERPPPSRPDADQARSEWRERLTVSAVRWVVRLSALFVGLACWHYASSRGLTFYIRFENVPGPLRVAEALLGHLQSTPFYLHVAVSLGRIAISSATWPPLELP